MSAKPTQLSNQGLTTAVDFVMFDHPSLPVTNIEKLVLPLNSREASRSLEIVGILKDYAARAVSSPISVAVFGPPGSGKSFSVKQIVKAAGCAEPRIINLSQLSSPETLAAVLASAVNVTAGDEAPKETKVFFFDEFDAPLNGVSLGWLRWFLSPMQDGEIVYKGNPVLIGKAVFMFAGGTAVSLGEFEKRALQDENNYRDKKVPDFISRLRGFIDIEGVNGLDEERHVRRALVLRRFLDDRWPNARKGNDNQFPIDGGIVRSLLSNVHFVHGVRSMQALLDMSRLTGTGPSKKVRLPDNDLRKLHLSRGLLDGKVIGISAGQEDPEAEDLLILLADKLLRNGATLAYGGDFTPTGILSKVIDAASNVPDELVTRTDKRIRNYLGFPSFLRETVTAQISPENPHAEFLKLGTLSDSEIEAFGVPRDRWFRARSEGKASKYNPHHLAWAISLFRMRVRLIQDIDALIVLGGKNDGLSWGRFSGIAEEVMLAFALNKPVYVLGGRKGAALEVGRLLGLDHTIANPETCLVDDQTGMPMSSEMHANYFALPGQPELPRTIADIRTFLFERGVTTPSWPRNGLNVRENRELFSTPIGPGTSNTSSRSSCADLIIAGLLRLDWKPLARPTLG